MAEDPRQKRLFDSLETLDGQRSKARMRQAVRFEHLQPILELPGNLQSAKSVAAPTKAEFDKLQGDVKDLYNRLYECQNLLRKALLNQS